MTTTGVEIIRGSRLAWDRGGPRGAVAFVWGHGLTSGRSNEDGVALIDHARLRETLDVVRYDALGHGESDLLTDPTRGSWAELARDQVALVDALEVDRVVVGGASMGAATALHAAPLLGQRLERLVLVIPPTGWATRAAQVDMYEKMAAIVEQRGTEPLIAAARTMPPPDPFLDDGEWLDHRIRSLERADRMRHAACLRGAAHADLPPLDDLATIAVPTLILAWTGDAGHPVDTAEILDDTMPMTELVVSSTRAGVAGWTDRILTFLS